MYKVTRRKERAQLAGYYFLVESYTLGSNAIAEVGPIGNVMSICRHDVVCLMVMLVVGVCRVLIFSSIKGLVGEGSMFMSCVE